MQILNTTSFSPRMALSGLLCSLLTTVACSSSEHVRENPRVSEIETTSVRGGNITIRRSEFSYISDKLKELRFFENGADQGRLQFAWSKGKLVEAQITDAEGDRANSVLKYTKGRLEAINYIVPSHSSADYRFEYDDAQGGREKQVTSVFHRDGSSSPSTVFEQFRYNEDGMLEEINKIDGDDSEVEEFSFDEDKRLDRVIRYRNNRHVVTYDFSYGPGNQLIEITNTDSLRYTLSFNKEGRLSETVQTGGNSGAIVTTRYSYESGGTAGLSVRPELPYASLLDLEGQSFTDIDFMHLGWAVQDIPRGESRPKEGDDGGTGPGDDGDDSTPDDNTNGTCQDFPLDTACNQCVAAECCEDIIQCNGSLACNNYIECEQDCSTVDCQTECRYAHPTGASELESLRSCARGYCASDCDL